MSARPRPCHARFMNHAHPLLPLAHPGSRAADPLCRRRTLLPWMEIRARPELDRSLVLGLSGCRRHRHGMAHARAGRLGRGSRTSNRGASPFVKAPRSEAVVDCSCGNTRVCASVVREHRPSASATPPHLRERKSAAR
jgi:hypothetical protein